MSERGLPNPATVKNPELRWLYGKVHAILGELTGRAAFRDRALTVADLQDIGIVGVQGTRLYNPNKPAAATLADTLAAQQQIVVDATGNPVTADGDWVMAVI